MIDKKEYSVYISPNTNFPALYRTKSEAVRKAKQIRAEGHLARPIERKGFWLVYVRKLEKKRPIHATSYWITYTELGEKKTERIDKINDVDKRINQLEASRVKDLKLHLKPP
jgi:hypothetical protein